jgi:predicted nucleic acid-binding protein
MRYLLDTDIVSELIRNPQGSVTERVREVGESQVATSHRSLRSYFRTEEGAASLKRRGDRGALAGASISAPTARSAHLIESEHFVATSNKT